ncbi:hypothetical protein BYT27DRAFT_6940732 [Phlegmacium glaucopus]|nr:hypothetical protein BYT27DRAFT_6940732 [Phlegmacium glaucopus]
MREISLVIDANFGPILTIYCLLHKFHFVPTEHPSLGRILGNASSSTSLSVLRHAYIPHQTYFGLAEAPQLFTESIFYSYKF